MVNRTPSKGDSRVRVTLLALSYCVYLIRMKLEIIAKDFKLEVLKDHFPHYFNPEEIYGYLEYKGPLPPYKYYEPKRTSYEEWLELKEEYKD